MTQPSGKLLVTLFVFIVGTVLGAAGRVFGTPGMIVGSLVGSVLGWVAGKWVIARIF
jgi:hypothetical protein